MNEVECLYCGENIVINSTPRVNQYLTCPFCKSVLQITSVSPLSVNSLEDNWESEAEPRPFRQSRKSNVQQLKRPADDFDEHGDDSFSRGRDSGKRNNEKNKRNRKKLFIEMDE